MSDLRKRFEERLSERVKIILIDCDFNDFENRYCYCDFERKDDFNLGVINGAWYMFFEDHEKQQAIINDLKAQLNNMEACYIEKKKELEDQLNQTKYACGRYDRLYEEYRLLELLVGNYRVLAQEVLPRCSLELLENIEGWEQALRGANA